ncbi:MAG TPA: hypothetical protein PLB62_14375, partial [Candidatus Sumerlaeota bacterium]|nr:hypothetical protein [Candidatus Sumerlaeota bacterium]
LDGSPTPKFRQIESAEVVPGRDASTDVFRYKGRLYAIKHPGMFFLGTLAYKPLSLCGLRYETHFPLATALVSWLTSGLIAALAGMLLFLRSREAGLSIHASLVTALCPSLASPIFAYSGILHHDLIGGCLLLLSWLIITKKEESSHIKTATGGLLAGFAFTTTPLAAFFIVPIALHAALRGGWRTGAFFAAGMAAGVAPLLLYNAAAFDNPFLLPNHAAGVRDTMAHLSSAPLGEKFIWYFLSPRTAIWAYAPWVVFAAGGFAHALARRAWDMACALAGILLLTAYVFTISSYGGAQFGPRYLLPALPLLAVGLIPALNWIGEPGKRQEPLRKTAHIVLGIAFCAGVCICLSGALRGTMHGMELHPFIQRVRVGMGLRGIEEAPGAFPLVYPLSFSAAAVFYFFPEKKGVVNSAQ